jgi:hypothetical protein
MALALPTLPEVVAVQLDAKRWAARELDCRVVLLGGQERGVVGYELHQGMAAPTMAPILFRLQYKDVADGFPRGVVHQEAAVSLRQRTLHVQCMWTSVRETQERGWKGEEEQQGG